MKLTDKVVLKLSIMMGNLDRASQEEGAGGISGATMEMLKLDVEGLRESIDLIVDIVDKQDDAFKALHFKDFLEMFRLLIVAEQQLKAFVVEYSQIKLSLQDLTGICETAHLAVFTSWLIRE